MSEISEKITELGLTLGFEHAAEMPARLIPCDPALRRFCEADICGQYKKCWMCPTATGSPETLIARLHHYKTAIVFTQEYPCNDMCDKAEVDGLHIMHERRSQLLWKCIQKLGRTKEDARVLTVGGCHLCPECACKTGEPCRHPDTACNSMSGYCVEVADMADRLGLDYIGKNGGIVFFAMALLK